MKKYLDGKLTRKEEMLLEHFDSSLFAKNLEGITEGLSKNKPNLSKRNRRFANPESDNRKSWLAVAASIIILIGIGSISYYSFKPEPVVAPVTQVVKSTPFGKRLRLQLSDGTHIHLNSGSTIEFPETFVGDIREVQLMGEAFFEVAKDSTKPFVISSDGIQTTVLGTSFNVNTYSESPAIKVTVKSGKVKIASKEKAVFLGANQQGVFDKQTKNIRKETISSNAFFAWKDGVLQFQDQPMETVAATLERWYGVNLNFENESIKDCHLTATFTKESLTAVLESIAYTKKGLAYQYINDREILITGSCTD